MNERLTGEDNDEIIEPPEIAEGKFDGFVVANGISIKVYWDKSLGSYFIDFTDPGSEINSEEIFIVGDSDRLAEAIFYDAKSLAMTHGKEHKPDVMETIDGEIRKRLGNIKGLNNI